MEDAAMIDITYSPAKSQGDIINSIQDVLRYYIKVEKSEAVFYSFRPNSKEIVDNSLKRIELLQQLLNEYPHEVKKMGNISVFRGKITQCQVGYCIDAPERVLSYIKQVTLAISNTKDEFIQPVERTFEMDRVLSVMWFGNELCENLIDDARASEVLAYINTNGVIIKLEVYKPTEHQVGDGNVSNL